MTSQPRGILRSDAASHEEVQHKVALALGWSGRGTSARFLQTWSPIGSPEPFELAAQAFARACEPWMHQAVLQQLTDNPAGFVQVNVRHMRPLSGITHWSASLLDGTAFERGLVGDVAEPQIRPTLAILRAACLRPVFVCFDDGERVLWRTVGLTLRPAVEA